MIRINRTQPIPPSVMEAVQYLGVIYMRRPDLAGPCVRAQWHLCHGHKIRAMESLLEMQSTDPVTFRLMQMICETLRPTTSGR